MSRSTARLFSFRRPIVWLYALLLVLGGVLFLATSLGPAINAPLPATVVWVAAVVEVVVLLLVARLVIPRGRARTLLLVLAALLGGVTVTMFASIVNSVVPELLGITPEVLGNEDLAFNLQAAFVGPVVEEVLKLLAVLVVLLIGKSVLRGPMDGLAVGLFVGIGFTVVENISFAMTGVDGASPTLAGAWGMVLDRMLLGFGNHAIFAAISGAALAFLLVHGRRAWAWFAAGFGTAILLHITWNGVSVSLDLIDIPEWVGYVVLIAVQLVYIAIFIMVRVQVGRADVRLLGADPNSVAPRS